MKKLSTIILLIISGSTYSQTLKEKLQGDWLCTRITDSKGNVTSGKFGESGDYLRFSFSKGNLAITVAPFDTGIKLAIKYSADSIDLFPLAVYDLPERKYKVKVEASDLILSTKGENGETISYHFNNKEKILWNISEELAKGEKIIIDNGLVAVKHIKLSKNDNGANRAFEYRISSETPPGPIFKDNVYASFGSYFSSNFVFPKSYQLEALSEELIVEFDVDGKGADNIKMIRGISHEIDASTMKLIERRAKRWTPLVVNEEPITTTLRFHFIFWLGVDELRFPWRWRY